MTSSKGSLDTANSREKLVTDVQCQIAEVHWQILIDASNGASDYGNKFGEPLLAGYTRTFGLRLPNGERREWIKPIMFRFCSLMTRFEDRTHLYMLIINSVLILAVTHHFGLPEERFAPVADPSLT